MMARRTAMVTILAGVLLLAGCGRKSALDTPYQAALDDRAAAEDGNRPPEPERPAADRPFILDGLID